jgi:hypothetical protein
MLQQHSLPHNENIFHECKYILPGRSRSTILSRRPSNTATMDDTCEKSDDGPETSQKHAALPLRYRTRAIWLLGFYILLILIPWVLTCIVAHRPINSRSYTRQQGFLDYNVSNMRKWKIAVDVLNSIAGLITSKPQIF